MTKPSTSTAKSNRNSKTTKEVTMKKQEKQGAAQNAATKATKEIAPPVPTKAKKERAPLKARWGAQLNRTATRFNRIAKMLGDEHNAELNSAVALLWEAAEVVAGLPEDFKPARGAAIERGPRIEVGETVDLRPKAAARYEGVLEKDETVGLTVSKIVGKRGLLISRSGIKFMLPLAQVVKQAPTA